MNLPALVVGAMALALTLACGDDSASDAGPVVDTGGSADTAGGADTGNADTGNADTGNADTGSADTGGGDTGNADTGGDMDAGSDAGGLTATLTDLRNAIDRSCDAVLLCPGEGGDCAADSRPDLLDGVRDEGNGTPACEAILFGEYVAYFDCLGALSCDAMSTDLTCEAMLNQARIDAACP